jgi:hypothetical protein
MTTMFKHIATAAWLGCTLMAIEPAAAQQGQSAPTEAQKAACLKMAQEFERETGHHGVTVRSSCLKNAADKNAAARWEYICTQPGGKAVYGCSKTEHAAQAASAARAANIQQKLQADAARAARMQREMDAEARALKKMQDERQRSKPTTEHCLMKNGKLECKPV